MRSSTAAPVVRKRVLMTVTAYPQPVAALDEMVCTAGLCDDGSWMRIYPVPFSFLEWSKFTLIELDLKRNLSDPRPESFSPVHSDLRDLEELDKIGPDQWYERTKRISKKVYTSRAELIHDRDKPKIVSLATFKPVEFLDFEIESASSEWPKDWIAKAKQADLFSDQEARLGKIIRKVPYKFYYRYRDDDGNEIRQRIIDFEIGQLFWNTLKNAEGDEQEALSKVKQKYWDEFMEKRDVYLFLGTTKSRHFTAPNPFLIIGVYYPPKVQPAPLFE